MMTTTKQIFKPILFSTEMVQAILEGRKTQTRRTKNLQNVNHCPEEWDSKGDYFNVGEWEFIDNVDMGHHPQIQTRKEWVKMPYKKGDILWVRETWFYTRYDWKYLLKMGINHIIKYKADNNYDPKKDCVGRSWKPSIHMPKLACRIFLEVTDVRVERLQDISEQDAKAEGASFIQKCSGGGFKEPHFQGFDKDLATYQAGFENIWYAIYGHESWIANPWVWVYEFKRVEKPENFLL